MNKYFYLLMWVAAVLLPGTRTYANNESVRFAEQVNLALRRTAHHLLLANGDSLTGIPAVEQTDPNTFSVVIENLDQYDELPKLLQQSLSIQKISRGYNVMVFDCKSGLLKLGYNLIDMTQPGGVACATRSHAAGCYRVQISFDPLPLVAASGGTNSWWLLPFGSVVAGLGLLAWKRSRGRKTPIAQSDLTIPSCEIPFGSSVYNSQNFILKTGDTRHQLTYRESKLLHLFIRHANQVLERDYILKAVWEDEGVVVSRSIDVFVSRLRKLLAADHSIKITAIHGVGYKMEIHS